MMDAKALLDSLMGPSRNKAPAEKRTDEWKEKNVCKRFLVGFCPNDCNDNWFHNTRRDTGLCTKVHSQALKDDFLAHPDRPKYQEEYEMDFLKYLESINSEADAWIAREKGNCATFAGKSKLNSSAKETMAKMKEEADAEMKRAEEFADNGDIESSKRAAEKSRTLMQDMEALKNDESAMAKGDTVCEVCGVRCNADDKSNYQAHLNSNLHKAYVQTRAKAKELREQMRNPSIKPRDDGVEKIRKEKSSEHDNRKEKDSDRRRRSQEGGKEKDRERRSRDRDRERRRDGGNDRRRDRSRSRGDRRRR